MAGRCLAGRRCPTAARTSCCSPPCSRRCSTTPFQQRLAQTHVALGAARAAACCGTTSPSTTRATPTCAACRWRACASCFPQAACSTDASRWRRRWRARCAALHPALYPVFNALPLLRTHVLAWIAKAVNHEPSRSCPSRCPTSATRRSPRSSTRCAPAGSPPGRRPSASRQTSRPSWATRRCTASPSTRPPPACTWRWRRWASAPATRSSPPRTPSPPPPRWCATSAPT